MDYYAGNVQRKGVTVKAFFEFLDTNDLVFGLVVLALLGFYGLTLFLSWWEGKRRRNKRLDKSSK